MGAQVDFFRGPGRVLNPELLAQEARNLPLCQITPLCTTRTLVFETYCKHNHHNCIYDCLDPKNENDFVLVVAYWVT